MDTKEGFITENNDYFYGVQLTQEQFQLIKSREIQIYDSDGIKLFPIVKDGKPTGEYMFYVIFR